MVNSSHQGFEIVVVASCRDSPGELFLLNASTTVVFPPTPEISQSIKLTCPTAFNFSIVDCRLIVREKKATITDKANSAFHPSMVGK